MIIKNTTKNNAASRHDSGVKGYVHTLHYLTALLMAYSDTDSLPLFPGIFDNPRTGYNDCWYGARTVEWYVCTRSHRFSRCWLAVVDWLPWL